MCVKLYCKYTGSSSVVPDLWQGHVELREGLCLLIHALLVHHLLNLLLRRNRVLVLHLQHVLLVHYLVRVLLLPIHQTLFIFLVRLVLQLLRHSLLLVSITLGRRSAAACLERSSRHVSHVHLLLLPRTLSLHSRHLARCLRRFLVLQRVLTHQVLLAHRNVRLRLIATVLLIEVRRLEHVLCGQVVVGISSLNLLSLLQHVETRIVALALTCPCHILCLKHRRFASHLLSVLVFCEWRSPAHAWVEIQIVHLVILIERTLSVSCHIEWSLLTPKALGG